MIKYSLHKALYLYPTDFWDGLIHDIKVGLRMVVSGVHDYMPFQFVYKQPCFLWLAPIAAAQWKAVSELELG